MEKIADKIYYNFRKAIERYGLIDENDKIMIGLSGGKDSLALVEFLARKRRAKNLIFR